MQHLARLDFQARSVVPNVVFGGRAERGWLSGTGVERFFRHSHLGLIIAAGAGLSGGGPNVKKKNERTCGNKNKRAETRTETWNLALHGSPIVPASWNGRAEWTERILPLENRKTS